MTASTRASVLYPSRYMVKKSEFAPFMSNGFPECVEGNGLTVNKVKG